MNDDRRPGIYLIVALDWPQLFKPECGQLAKELHNSVEGQSWIREILAASGGLGGGQSAIWVFWLENYSALDRLPGDRNEPAAEAYRAFFSVMESVEDKVREEVIFS